MSDFSFGLFRFGGSKDKEITSSDQPKTTEKKIIVDPYDFDDAPIVKPSTSSSSDSARRSWEMSGRGGEGTGELGVRRESSISSFGSSWSSKTAYDAITGEPASTYGAAAKGITAPTRPKLFLGAQIRLTDGKTAVTGTLVGYDSNGRAIIKQPGKPELTAPRDAELALLPNQQWKSALESLPANCLVRPSPADLAALRRLTDERAGSGDNVRDYVRVIRDAGFEAFVSGGAIRDVLNGVQPRDVDLCTTMWCEDVSSAARSGKLSSGSSRTSFGTLLINNLDITSLKRARGEFGFDLYEDAKYRDFTVNALYFDPASGIIADPFGTGVSDAKNKILRPSCRPGDEQAWIKNNSSAVLRLFKFTLKGYKPTPELLRVIKENFKWAMNDMDGMRKSRTMESIRGGKSEITAEMKRLGLESEIDLVYPSFRGRDDDGPSSGSGGMFSFPWLRSGRSDDDDKPKPTSTASSSGLGGSWQETGPGRSRYVAGPSSGSSSSSRLEDYAKANGYTVGRPSMETSSLAIARGHLGFVESREEQAIGTLIKAGFSKRGPGHWQASDGSWVRFVEGNVYRGHEKKIFADIPWGSGPR